MLSIETRINGILIGYASVTRKLQADLDNDKNYIYYVEYHKIGLKSRIINFRVVHNIDEGAEKLVLLVYQEIDKRLKIGNAEEDNEPSILSRKIRKF